jgi:hypothetical protein
MSTAVAGDGHFVGARKCGRIGAAEIAAQPRPARRGGRRDADCGVATCPGRVGAAKWRIMPPDSTLANVASPRHRRGVALRVAGLGLLALVVLAGAAGAFGVRTATAAASGGGYDLTVHYPWLARAGLDVPWSVTIHHDGGFSEPITVGVSASYFDIFETQGFHPQPSKETATPTTVYLEFDPPPGDTFKVSYDAYIQPAAQLGRHATVTVSVKQVEMTSVRYATWLVP